MAKTDLQALRAEAEKTFPGDRARQDAYVSAMMKKTPASAPSTTTKRAPASKKKAKPAPSTRRFRR